MVTYGPIYAAFICVNKDGSIHEDFFFSDPDPKRIREIVNEYHSRSIAKRNRMGVQIVIDDDKNASSSVSYKSGDNVYEYWVEIREITIP